MALSSTSMFAPFDVNDGSQERDISPVLADAIFYDTHLLGALNVDFGAPATDTTHYWNEDLLNSDTATTSASAASNGTSISLSSGHGARVHVGDLFYDTASGSTEVGQVTAISTDTLTVTRAYNSTTAASIASGATLAFIRAEQDGSDISTDNTVAPRVRKNDTQIFSGNFNVQITGSQLARKMATTQLQDFLARQVQNRTTELKINMTRGFLYSEKSATSGGSDTAYRTLAGIRSWINAASGVTNSTAQALSYTNLNSVNTSIVNLGVTPNLLVMGTDLVGSLAGIDSGNRRLVESDRNVGYAVQRVLLNQGNEVDVVIDSRVKTGDAFLLDRSRIRCLPLDGRGMVVIAAVDFADAKKRRVLGEWTLEYRNPEAGGYLFSKT